MRNLLTLAVSGALTIVGISLPGEGTEHIEKPKSSAAGIVVEYEKKEVPAKVIKFDIDIREPDILDEVIGKKIPSFTHMLYVAWCESQQTWNDHGQYAGGFGFMHKSNKVYKDYSAKQSTWLQWGGAQFAKRPQDATSKEQALVWIRTYATGWIRPTGEFKPPVRPMKSLCHDDIPFGLHVHRGEEWPVPDDWQPGDPPVKPWDK